MAVKSNITRENGNDDMDPWKSKKGQYNGKYLFKKPALMGVRLMIYLPQISMPHTKEDYDIERFWKLESLGIQGNDKLNTEKQNIKEFSSTSITYEDGKYVANFPWIEECHELPTNKMIARARTHRVVNRLNQEPNVFKIYGDIIKEQENVVSSKR
ncbi:Hypothetical predicted protein [Mytilus galloprovincialis]|uniref:Uncharacterized protein n=1 Tax=Mytilus galloprovincialis TaxID=29158 RepID=A0A8B6F8G6_MYTGA|nr:Hypothetical predicted protein [Mytilus galloprovincialis]